MEVEELLVLKNRACQLGLGIGFTPSTKCTNKCSPFFFNFLSQKKKIVVNGQGKR